MQAPELKLQPIEQTVPELFEVAGVTYFEPDQASHAIRQYPGLVPVAITPEPRVVWLDVGDYRFKEWKFRYAIRNVLDHQGLGSCFSTHLPFLGQADNVLTDNVPPGGFVFHMSKCGSTLMAKALAAPTPYISISEASPLHENFWQYLTQGWSSAVELTDTNLALIRNLILAMGRRRLREQQHYFVKFRSWNINFIKAIQSAFPETPCLFMYREPAEVLVSSLYKSNMGQSRLKESQAGAFMTGCPTAELRGLSDLHYFTRLHQRHMTAALTEAAAPMHYLNYRQLTQQNFPRILEAAFGHRPAMEDLPLMLEQFEHYAKDDSGATRFVPDSGEKQRLVTPEVRAVADRDLMQLYGLLEDSPLNLNRVLQ